MHRHERHDHVDVDRDGDADVSGDKPVASQRLYRTADDRVVVEGDPDAAFLLAAEGDEIPDGYAEPAAGAKPAAKRATKPAAKAQ